MDVSISSHEAHKGSAGAATDYSLTFGLWELLPQIDRTTTAEIETAGSRFLFANVFRNIRTTLRVSMDSYDNSIIESIETIIEKRQSRAEWSQ